MILQEKIKNTSLLNKELSNEEVKSIVEPARESVNAKTALFSICPEYVEKIFNGTKKFEYRKQPNRIPISKILIYETAPIMKIVGEAEVEKVLVDTPEVIWEKTKEYPGINKKFYHSAIYHEILYVKIILFEFFHIYIEDENYIRRKENIWQD